AKAVTLGLIEADQTLEQEDLIDLLFASGVSTAQEVTEVSGRGVGMDVVKRNIDAANGKMSIATEAGKGTTFSIQLAKTVSTQIIDGFLLGVGDSVYVAPMEQVLEVFYPEPGSVTNVAGRGTCVLRHDQLLHVIDLRRILKAPCSVDEAEEKTGIMVATHVGKRRAAILVDEVLSVQKVVVKELKGLELPGDLYAGAAVMGDGTVAMILDLNALETSEMGI
ncbi:MAG: chemotaxis protein CheW, partial [Planctomycetes bacterium]|nr:chemotaxis protein CheW [Planctomycetota bacterium]